MLDQVELRDTVTLSLYLHVSGMLIFLYTMKNEIESRYEVPGNSYISISYVTNDKSQNIVNISVRLLLAFPAVEKMNVLFETIIISSNSNKNLVKGSI